MNTFNIFDNTKPSDSAMTECSIPSYLNEKPIENNALDVLKLRYFMTLNNKKETTFSELCARVAHVVAAGETAYTDNGEYINALAKSIYNDMMSHRFLFNSPGLFSAGVGMDVFEKELHETNFDLSHAMYKDIFENKAANQMMFACFVIPINDSLEDIFNSVRDAAVISKYGGGVGTNFSRLREKDSNIAGGCGGKSSGPVSFMQTWNTMGSVVVQGGKRRAALMGMLNIDHPDIEEFIDAKTKDGELSYFNISVAINNKFMEAVKNDEMFDLISPATNTVIKSIKARDLWDKICNSAHKRGDPGVFFIDLAQEDSILKWNDNYVIESTNPCVTGDTLVATPNGWVKAMNISVGDDIITVDGVESVRDIEVNHDIETYRVEFSNGGHVNATMSHQFRTFNNHEFSFVQLKDIKINETEIQYEDLTEICNDGKLLLYKDDDKYSKYITVTSITPIGKHTVYDIHAPISDTWITNGYVSRGCGEQPLIVNNDNNGGSSCNLGSINVYEFVDKETKTFKTDEFIKQIYRAMYYLDLVIDVTSYPLESIEANTKDIRPIGLGIMGLADAAIELGYKYGTNEFLTFCDFIGSTLSVYSLKASVRMAATKGAYPACNVFINKLREICNYDCDTVWGYDSYHRMLNNNVFNNDDIPRTFKNTLVESMETFDCNLFAELLCNGLRNSRRLTIAPTGTISLLLNTSSSIEPNFAFEWTREVVVDNDNKTQLKYYHRLNTPENESNGLLVTAHDLDIKGHVMPVAIFAKYIDAAISKTVNLPEDADVSDVEAVYQMCFKNNIKGITIYRNNSRSFQPLKIEDKKEDEPKVVCNQIVQKRPKIMSGLTTKSDSPWGSIYVTLNFDSNGKTFETFISAGKSGSENKAVTEALSRVISLALRAGVELNDIIQTISNISGSEVWVYENEDKTEVYVKSIPDVVAKMLADLKSYHKELNDKINGVKVDVDKASFSLTQPATTAKDTCPECGVKLRFEGGCNICPNCGHSDCR